MKFILLTLIFGLSSAAYISDEPCPNRPVVSSIDVSKISGNWYVVKGFPLANPNAKTDCFRYTFTATGDYEYDRKFCKIKYGVQQCEDAKFEHKDHNGKFNYVDGRKINKNVYNFRYFNFDLI